MNHIWKEIKKNHKAVYLFNSGEKNFIKVDYHPNHDLN